MSPLPSHDGNRRPAATRHGPIEPVEFLDARRITFVEHPPPELSPRERREMDRMWVGTRARHPDTFDGPLVASLGVDLPSPGALVARWARITYRYRALRRLRPPEDVPGSVFVTVLMPTEAGLVVGRGSPATAAAGSWTLPGGSVEPPAEGRPLDAGALRLDAVRELAEEVGVRITEEEVRLFAVTRGRRFGSLGFHFLAPPVARALVLRRHAELVAAETGQGAGPELDELAFVSSPAEADRLGPGADYLRQVLHRYASGRSASGAAGQPRGARRPTP
ncbi:NUDIX domain-containing protein [Streptomyces sp. NPDC017254]|uniref:NUDIX domain-containing protein n=1 Tax=unclassified Streptomyces TaxID=2593676 RepID=UPI0037B5654D